MGRDRRATPSSSPSPSASTTTSTGRPATAARSARPDTSGYEANARAATPGDAARARPARRRRAPPRPADRRARRRAAGVRRRGRVAVPCRLDVQNEHLRTGLGVPPPLHRGRRRVRVLLRAVRAAAGFPATGCPSSRRRSTRSRPRTRLISGPDVRQSLQPVGLLAGGSGRTPARRSAVATARPVASAVPVDLLGTGPPPPADVPIVLQASRWDCAEGHAGRDDRLRRARGGHGRGPSRAGRPERRRRRRRPRSGRGPRRVPHHLAEPARTPCADGSTWSASR